ncbi:MAG: hypothetical protein D6815_08200 [Candidatus Dadabacteria bacterium]|nr:MAG: hypothetical protein D6815_08200 [Candidatus Dadabacteria bacterium]
MAETPPEPSASHTHGSHAVNPTAARRRKSASDAVKRKSAVGSAQPASGASVVVVDELVVVVLDVELLVEVVPGRVGGG